MTEIERKRLELDVEFARAELDAAESDVADYAARNSTDAYTVTRLTLARARADYQRQRIDLMLSELRSEVVA